MKSVLSIFVLCATLGLVACDTNDGPFEELGENIDETTEQFGDRVAEAAEQACENAEERVRRDLDC